MRFDLLAPSIRAGNLSGIHIHAAVTNLRINLFDTYMIPDATGKLELQPCFVLEMILALQYALNFTYDIKVTDHWGFYNANTSKWQGAVGALVDGTADFALSSTFHTSERRKAVDFTIPPLHRAYVLVFRQPNLLRNALALFRPFEPNLWVGTFAMIMIVAGSVVIIVILLITSTTKSVRYGSIEIRHDRLLDYAFWVINFICSKGISNSLNVACIKVVLVSGFMMGFMLSALYSSMLTSFLSVPLQPPTTLEQLLATSWKFGGPRGSLAEILSISTIPSVQELKARLEPESPELGTSVPWNRILKGKYGFLAYDLTAFELHKTMSEEERCSIRSAYLPFARVHIGPIVRKGFAYKQYLNRGLLRCMQYGLNRRWSRKYLPRRYECVQMFSTDDGIPLESTAIAVGILAIGLLMSMVGISLEKCVLHNESSHLTSVTLD